MRLLLNFDFMRIFRDHDKQQGSVGLGLFPEYDVVRNVQVSLSIEMKHMRLLLSVIGLVCFSSLSSWTACCPYRLASEGYNKGGPIIPILDPRA